VLHPGPVHQNRTIQKLLVLGNLADDIGPECAWRVCIHNYYFFYCKLDFFYCKRDFFYWSGSTPLSLRLSKDSSWQHSFSCGFLAMTGTALQDVFQVMEWPNGLLVLATSYAIELVVVMHSYFCSLVVFTLPYRC
jgi:hypothetical protein